MMHNPSAALLAMVIAYAASTGVAVAEIYKWTDKNGKVHFGDTPPEDQTTGAQVEATNVKTPTTFQGQLDTKQVVTKKPIPTINGTSLRKVSLEKIVISLTEGNGGDVAIGRTYLTSACDKKNSNPIYSPDEGLLKDKGYMKQFVKTLQSNNYPVVAPSAELFDVEHSNQADLLIGAAITDIKVNICNKQTGRQREIQVASYLKIKWQVFDPLNRQVIFETTTEGSDQLSTMLESEVKQTDVRSFGNATINLLAQADFMKVLMSNNAPVKTSYTGPVSVKLNYGKGGGDFVKQVEQLKSGTVTIRSSRGHGSGLIVSKDGYVITNAHVVGKSSEVLVIANDKKYRASVVKEDSVRDVVLLKMESASALTPLPLSNNTSKTGETVYVIGTPLDENLSHTVTRGILSAERVMEGKRFYQTDAAINPGNSGGPAFNNNGEVIGITVAGMFAKDGASLNINFLIPINEVVATLDLAGN